MRTGLQGATCVGPHGEAGDGCRCWPPSSGLGAGGGAERPQYRGWWDAGRALRLQCSSVIPESRLSGGERAGQAALVGSGGRSAGCARSARVAGSVARPICTNGLPECNGQHIQPPPMRPGVPSPWVALALPCSRLPALVATYQPPAVFLALLASAHLCTATSARPARPYPRSSTRQRPNSQRASVQHAPSPFQVCASANMRCGALLKGRGFCSRAEPPAAARCNAARPAVAEASRTATGSQ